MLIAMGQAFSMTLSAGMVVAPAKRICDFPDRTRFFRVKVEIEMEINRQRVPQTQTKEKSTRMREPQRTLINALHLKDGTMHWENGT